MTTDEMKFFQEIVFDTGTSKSNEEIVSAVSRPLSMLPTWAIAAYIDAFKGANVTNTAQVFEKLRSTLFPIFKGTEHQIWDAAITFPPIEPEPEGERDPDTPTATSNLDVDMDAAERKAAKFKADADLKVANAKAEAEAIKLHHGDLQTSPHWYQIRYFIDQYTTIRDAKEMVENKLKITLIMNRNIFVSVVSDGRVLINEVSNLVPVWACLEIPCLRRHNVSLQLLLAEQIENTT